MTTGVLRLFRVSSGRCTLQLLGLAGILLVCHVFYGFVLPLTPGRLERPSAALIGELPLWSRVASLPLPVPQSGTAAALALMACGCLAFGAYGWALWLVRSRAAEMPATAVVVVPGLVFMALSTLYFPNLNTDIYNYILRGRILGVHGSNPYVVPADEFPADPLYPYASHRFTQTADGKLPAWMLPNSGVAALAGDDPVDNLLLYRSAFLLLNAANVGMIYGILKAIAPQRLLFGTLFFAWNPIVSLFGQSKCDTIMLFYLLAGVLLLVKGRPRLAMAAFTLSVFTKLITLPLVAIHWLRTWRREPRRALLDALLAAAVMLMIYLPFWRGIGLILRHVEYMSAATTDAAGYDTWRLGAAVLFGGFVFWLGLRGRGSFQNLLDHWGWALLLFAVTLSKEELAWYLIVPVAVLALCEDRRLPVAGFLIAFGSFLINTWHAVFTDMFRAPVLPDARAWFQGLSLALLFVLFWRGRSPWRGDGARPLPQEQGARG
jgi:hypothetical protein